MPEAARKPQRSRSAMSLPPPLAAESDDAAILVQTVMQIESQDDALVVRGASGAESSQARVATQQHAARRTTRRGIFHPFIHAALALS